MIAVLKPIRCRICGETYLGTSVPERCPFCGAHASELVTDEEGFAGATFAVQPTELERADLETAIELERSNARFYAAVARLEGDETLASAYKRLSRIEAEHCSVFSKLADQPRPDDLLAPLGDPTDWCDAVLESARREEHAAQFYAEAAGRATDPRIHEVFTAIASVESDHIVFDGWAAERLGC